MIKILHVGLSDNKGGIESVVRNWVNFLPEDVRFDFINVSDKHLAFESDFINNGCTVYRITSRKKNYVRSNSELTRIIRMGNYDYIHYHAMSLSWMEPVLIGLREGVKPIIHSHCDISDCLSTKYRILNWIGKHQIYGKPILYMACGEKAGESMFGDNKFVVVENGIKLTNFSFSVQKRNRVRERYGIKNEEILIGHVGRSGPPKNYPFLIHCFSKLNKEYKLMLIGNVDNDPEILELIEKYKVIDRVIFTGIVEDTADLYSAMDIFFFPSLYEGFSVAMLEAQACGLPCVVSNRVSSELAVSAKVAFVSIENDKEAIDKLRFFSSPIYSTERERRQIIDKKYDVEASSDKIFNFYREHLKGDKKGESNS